MASSAGAAIGTSRFSGWNIGSLGSWGLSNLREKGISAAFQIASYLTDPVCKSHELFRRVYLVDTLNPAADRVSNQGRKFFLSVGSIAAAAVATVTTVPGIILRSLASRLQDKPFLYFKGELPEKVLTENRFSLLSWNVCFPSGGYSISDGGVTPWPQRISSIADKIHEQNAEVVCLYEVFDVKAAFHLYEKMKKEYAHFYFNIGPKAVGVSSGILIASKYKIADPEFSAFPQEALVGRTKYAAKGVFDFSIQSQGKSFSKIYATHLQHSEQCDFATGEEKEARVKQMKIIMDRMDQAAEKLPVILTGDLNLDDDEFLASDWSKHFIRDASGRNKKTWGGDGYCAAMVGKKASPPLNLDYTLVKKGTETSITTSIVETGFVGTQFIESALSDHEGLLSCITI